MLQMCMCTYTVSGLQVTILHGLNLPVDHKFPPFDQLRGRLDDLDPLPLWGVNVARLVFTWEAFETVRGHYNITYLDYLGSIIDVRAPQILTAKFGIRASTRDHTDFGVQRVFGCHWE
jgi:hypothetical protein